MAVGDIVYQKSLYAAIRLLQAQTTDNGKPAGATAGVDITGAYIARPGHTASIVLKGTCTAGQTLAATFRLWGYSPELGDWCPLGTGTDAAKGVLNGGSALGETDTDKITHAEAVQWAGHFTRIYLEMSSSSGTGRTFDALLIVSRNDRISQ